MKKNNYIIIDFDSTFVELEALDELSKIVLSNNPNRENIVKQIEEITQLGMEGKITFPESLAKRLQLFQPHKNHIEQLVALLSNHITPSFMGNKDFIKENSESFYIISGGFKEFILPIVNPFGIKDDHVLANSFVFDDLGNISGFDTNNVLCQELGKVKQIQQLTLDGTVTVIGDGFTDYQIKEKGYADTFIYFAENVTRPSLIEKADLVANSFDEIVSRFELS